MEEALFETPLYRDFASLSSAQRIPDRVSILRFSHLLEEHQLSIQLLATVNSTLAAKHTESRHNRSPCKLEQLATAKEHNMAANKQAASRPHDAAVVDLLRADPAFANEYLAAALEEADEPGGQAALLAALRHVAEAQGMAAVAERAGIPRESLYRALSPKGNPTIKTLMAVLGAAGLHLVVARSAPTPT